MPTRSLFQTSPCSRFGGRRTAVLQSLSLLLAFAFPVLGAPSGPEPTCLLLSKEGKVEVARRGAAQWAAAQTNQMLNVGDRLRTGLRSRATLRWSDLSVVRVDELTSMEIQPPDKSKDKPQLELKSGATYFFSREKPEEVHFRTPMASGAIRGTEFHLAVEADGRTVVSLIDGEVLLATAQGDATLRSGEQGVAAPGQPPRKTPLLDAINVIQWALYYPAVSAPEDWGLSTAEMETFAGVLAAYRAGDLAAALENYPADRQPASQGERAMQASLMLAAGRAAQAATASKSLASPVTNALREVLAAVKHRELPKLPAPTTASEWMARSYYQQSRAQLAEALAAAREAARKSPEFGAAWVRVAELEFGFGRTDAALSALQRGLQLSPRNAQGQALKGFILAAGGRLAEAERAFEEAIALDGSLGNGWLGRGLVRIRRGQGAAGRGDMQVAATLEPQRAVLRSYLGKAWSHAGDSRLARKELELARQLDPQDPTGWFYAALLDQQQNRINDAVGNLEKSKAMNDNRGVFRSRELLDQDQSVRSANLAAMYRDAGLHDRSVQEAATAVNSDYANYSAHLFLAQSFDVLRDPKLINLRYETPWFSELLLANLLGPASGGTFSPTISQQEYTRFFDRDHLGVFSETEYFSNGDWVQRGSQHGVFGRSSYALDAYYRTENGQRPNNDLEQLALALRFKHQLTAKDGLFFEVNFYDSESGDLLQYYDQATASETVRVEETQAPNVLVGYHRAWSPASHTLALFTRFDDTLEQRDTAPVPLGYLNWIDFFSGTPMTDLGGLNGYGFNSLNYRSELVAYSAEVQHFFQTREHTLIFGGRYQAGWNETLSELERAGQPVTDQSFETDLSRASVYLYEHWQLYETLRLSAGVSYDYLEYPRNIDTSPITSLEDSTDRVSPKAGLLFTPALDTRLRAMYSQSLGGVFFDNSVRLEPTQIAGFNQAFRSAIPESVAGLVPGTSFEAWGVGLDHVFRKTRTYLTVEGQFLNSDAVRTVGLLTNSSDLAPVPDAPSSTRESLDYREEVLIVALNQLLLDEWAVGVRYKRTHAELEDRYFDLPAAEADAAGLNKDVSATLNQVDLFAIFNHPCGFFARFDAIWSEQTNKGYQTPLPGDDFWHYNLLFGYRFLQRRVEARLALLNLSDRDYRLNPLTLYNELARERTLVASLKFNF